jgi:hypothetical protein
MLFNGVAGTRDPDYPGLFLGETFPIPLGIATVLIVIAGGIIVGRDSKQRIAPRAMGWLAMASVVPMSLLVMLVERPRPSYLFGLTLFLMAIVGICAAALVERWRWAKKLAPMMAPAMLLTAMLVPSYYELVSHGRPVLEDYERLRPFESLLAKPRAAFVGEYPQAAQAFVGHGVPDCFSYSLFAERPPQMGLAEFLNARGITVLELDPRGCVRLQLSQPQLLSGFLAAAPQHGWHLVASQQLRQGHWMLFSRQGPAGPINMQANASK